MNKWLNRVSVIAMATLMVCSYSISIAWAEDDVEISKKEQTVEVSEDILDETDSTEMQGGLISDEDQIEEENVSQPIDYLEEGADESLEAPTLEEKNDTESKQLKEEQRVEAKDTMLKADVIASGKYGSNLTWKLTGTNTEMVLTISGTGLMGDGNDYGSVWREYSSNIVNVIIEDGVTSIGNKAFYQFSSLKSVTIPDSVTSIGSAAFYNCSSLTSITIPDSVTSIGSSAFSNCSSLTSVIVPDGVTSINPLVFYDCYKLTSITIPKSVTSIGDRAFRNCNNLTSIIIPDSVTSIDTEAFAGCRKLTSITIPESVTSIGGYAFNDCSSLISITIPESVTRITGGIFQNCRSLTNITIPDGVTSIGDHAFDNCSSLTNITIPDNVTGIGDYAFSDCSSLSSITIPDGVTIIRGYAFNNCSSLISITIPDGVTSIWGSTFNNCSNLTSITIPDSVTSIGDYAFSNCSKLTSITIPDGVTRIGGNSFNNCSAFKTIYIPSGVQTIGEKAFDNCNNLTIYCATTAPYSGWNSSWNPDSRPVEFSMFTRGDYEYWSTIDKTQSEIVIPSTVTTIPKKAFQDCTSLNSIIIPNSVTSIGESAFSGCSSLECLIIPEKVTSIGNGAIPKSTTILTYSNSAADRYAQSNGNPVDYIDADISKHKATLSNTTFVFDGNEKCPTILFRGLEENVDYKVEYTNNVNAGTATVKAVGIGNYTGELIKEFTIEQVDISNYSMTISEDRYQYDGNEKCPTVSIGGLVEGTDFSVTYSNNIKAGTATVKVNGIGNYKGTITGQFVIWKEAYSVYVDGKEIEQYPSGAKVTILSNNDVAYESFSSWLVKSGDLVLSANQRKANPLTFNMPATDLEIQAIYTGQSLNEELQDENYRHNSVVSRASILKSNIETYTATANRIKNKYGVSYLQSSTYYNNQANSTQTELTKKQNRLAALKADTAGGHQVEIRQLEAEIKELQADYQMYIELKYAAEYQAKADSAQKELNRIDLNAEETAHNRNIANICKNHGVKDSSVAEIKYIRLDKEEYDYTGENIYPVVTVIDSNGKTLGKESYEVVYPDDCQSVGKHIITLVLKGNYVGTKEKTFTIVKHEYGDWVVTKEATCFQTGSRRTTCKDCGRVKIETIPVKHEWDEGKITKKATTSAPGEKLYTCTICGHQETRSEIPMVTAPTGKATILNTVANSSKKTNDVIWDKSKVTGATNYEIQWRTRGSSTWKSTTVGNTVRGVTTGLTIGGLYEIRVRPYKAATETTEAAYGTWSPIVYRYFFTTQKIRLTSKSKGTFTMSWAKDANATSYQVLYTTNKNGSGAAQNIKTAGKTATSITVKDIKVNGKVQKLQSGKTYYVQVREVRNVGGKNYIGNISCPVAVKVK